MNLHLTMMKIFDQTVKKEAMRDMRVPY